MKGVLLDTHTLIWAVSSPGLLGKRVRRILERPKVPVYLSIASVWELVLKRIANKITLPLATQQFLDQSQSDLGFAYLSIDVSHLLALEGLPNLHRDPFDRLIVAQATQEGIAVATRDKDIERYDIECVW